MPGSLEADELSRGGTTIHQTWGRLEVNKGCGASEIGTQDERTAYLGEGGRSVIMCHRTYRARKYGATAGKGMCDWNVHRVGVLRVSMWTGIQSTAREGRSSEIAHCGALGSLPEESSGDVSTGKKGKRCKRGGGGVLKREREQSAQLRVACTKYAGIWIQEHQEVTTLVTCEGAHCYGTTQSRGRELVIEAAFKAETWSRASRREIRSSDQRSDKKVPIPSHSSPNPSLVNRPLIAPITQHNQLNTTRKFGVQTKYEVAAIWYDMVKVWYSKRIQVFPNIVQAVIATLAIGEG
ncbi:hypothetical protein DFH09DRAFT_1107210 [Mycena vulgaris]|nr:hypothetical protein DFH09DRAFT_1107210 [Mycena vulgaris]